MQVLRRLRRSGAELLAQQIECGYVVRGADEDELIRNAEEHMKEAHPDLVGQISREDLLGMAEEAA